MPTVNFDNNQHEENENLRLGTFFDSIVTIAAVLRSSSCSHHASFDTGVTADYAPATNAQEELPMRKWILSLVRSSCC